MSEAWGRYGDLNAVTHADARLIAEKVRAPWTRGGPEMARITEHTISTTAGPVRIRCYDPGPAPIKPALIYLHGGGWTMFSLDTHDRVMREYAARAHMVVAGVDYALAPEAKYPVALEQVVAVVKFLAARGTELGINTQKMAIGGDSAGANLAIATCMKLRDQQLLRALLLNYGVFDRESSRDAKAKLGGPGNMLTADEMDGFWRNYLRGEEQANDPLVSPLRADLHHLPPTLVVVPEFDLLTEQSVHLAERLKSFGVPVKLEMYRGAVHSFLEAVSISSLASRAFDDSAAWLHDHV